MSATTALWNAIASVDTAVDAVDIALSETWQQIDQAAAAAAQILAADVAAETKRQAWVLVERLRLRFAIGAPLALELVEALVRGSWRKAKQPDLYLHAAVVRA